MQADLDYERRLGAQQSMIGNMMSMQSSLEPAYAQLMVGSQYLAPEKRDPGLIGGLLGGLGLF